MKSFRWLTLVAALLITAGEVLLLRNEAARNPPVTVTTSAEADGSTFAPGG